MKVQCDNVQSFIENLKGNGKLFENTVWTNVTKNPASEVVDNVMFQASALIQLLNESEYLVQLGIDCGKDYNDSSDDQSGTRNAEHYKYLLESWCNDQGLVVKPGIISE